MPVLFFALWIILSGRITLEIIVFGLLISLLMYLFMIRVLGWNIHRESRFWRTLPMLLLFFLNLIRETAIAAWAVTRLALSPNGHPEPVLVEFHSGLDRDWLNVLLANSITLTPGTITIFQEQDHFLVHALRREYAHGIEESSFVKLLRRFPE